MVRIITDISLFFPAVVIIFVSYRNSPESSKDGKPFNRGIVFKYLASCLGNFI